MTRRGDFWGFSRWMAEGGGRRRPRGQSTKQISASTQEPGQLGGEAAGPRLKSVGCGKVNGVRGLDVKGLGSLPIPEGLGLGSAIAGRRAAGLRGYMGRYTADHTVQGTWVEQAGKELGAPGGEIR